MAKGGEKPAWPLPTVTPKFATWSFGGGRPAGCAVGACERWHAGIDLTGAPHGALVIAPEDGIVAGLDRGWTDGTRAVFLQTDSGLFLVLGGVIAGSHKEFGLTTAQRIRKGDKLGRIVGGYGMLHLEAYKVEASRKANSRWWKDDPPPPGLLNPTSYVERMIGDRVSLLQTRQRLEALRDLGHYKGDLGAPWNAAAIDALKQAQAALGVTVDGKWGPETEDAIQKALAVDDPHESEDEGGETNGDIPDPAGHQAVRPLRLAGAIVAGVTVTGLIAAVVVTRRRRVAEEDTHGV